jgi:D-sedoheptulose 7-phosphate isomerase
MTPGAVRQVLGDTARLLDTMAEDAELCQAMATAAEACVASLRAGGKLLLCGDGGSAAE